MPSAVARACTLAVVTAWRLGVSKGPSAGVAGNVTLGAGVGAPEVLAPSALAAFAVDRELRSKAAGPAGGVEEQAVRTTAEAMMGRKYRRTINS